MTRSMMLEILEKHVEPLYCAEDGLEGWELFKKHQPKIVITDIRMPKMNGLEMIGQIRAMAPGTKVIITSAYSDTDYMLDAIELGVDRFCLKPVHMEKLLNDLHAFAHVLNLESGQTLDKALKIGVAQLVATMPLMAVVTDEQGMILQASNPFLEYFDWEGSRGLAASIEAQAVDICSLLETGSRGFFHAATVEQMCRMADDAVPFKVELIESSGNTRMFELRCQSMAMDSGRRYVIYFLDVGSEG